MVVRLASPMAPAPLDPTLNSNTSGPPGHHGGHSDYASPISRPGKTIDVGIVAGHAKRDESRRPDTAIPYCSKIRPSPSSGPLVEIEQPTQPRPALHPTRHVDHRRTRDQPIVEPLVISFLMNVSVRRTASSRPRSGRSARLYKGWESERLRRRRAGRRWPPSRGVSARRCGAADGWPRGGGRLSDSRRATR